MEKCPDIIDLENALLLPEDNPTRQHVEQCGHCQAILQSLELFDQNGQLPGDENVPGLQPEKSAQVEKHLDDFLGKITSANVTDSVVSFPRTRPKRLPIAWMGIAAALVAVIGLWSVLPALRNTSEIETVLRGEEVLHKNKLEVISVSLDKDANLVLVWLPIAEASHYEVVFWNDNLEEYSRLEPVEKPTTMIPNKLLPDPENAVYFSILAFNGKKELTRSPLMEIPNN